MEQIVSQKILLPIVPWFLQKYKPWTVKEAVVQHLYMGRSPPMITEMRVLRQSTSDDHLVLELGLNFRTADDMNAILAVKLKEGLGFGMWTKLHLTGMHVEGKVLVGVKFLRQWPFLGRLRVCFVEPPYFQMTVKPIFSHGLDVTELPGLAGWLDKLLALVFEQTLVEPNMLVVDMEKFVSPQPECWFSVNEKEPVAYAIVEVIEAVDMKPSDLNGLADPYVKMQLGTQRYRTAIQKKTLSPKWHEEFKIPIFTWESPNMLAIEVLDKDHIFDDGLGECSVLINDLRDGQRYDMWLPLQNIKMGRLHLAITVTEGNKKGPDISWDSKKLNDDNEGKSSNESSQKGSLATGLSEKPQKVADKFEPIDIQGQQETGIWVHQPGSEVSQIWEPRKGRSRLLDSHIARESAPSNNDSSSTEDSPEGNKGQPPNKVARGLQKIGSLFHRKYKQGDTSKGIDEPLPSPRANLKAVNSKETGVNLIVEDSPSLSSPVGVPKAEGIESPEGSDQESPHKKGVKDKAKSILKHAGRSASNVKHAFSGKGSKKSRRGSGSEATGSNSPGSKSSDEECLQPQIYASKIDGTPVVSRCISSSGGSFKSEKLNDQATPSAPAMDVEVPLDEVNVKGAEKESDISSSNSDQNDVLVKVSPTHKNSSEDLRMDVSNAESKNFR
ncbi:C2 domain-containing protein At1g53590 isoform X2 [Diospyros lotus]|nr:C2 domain-containing protein At1g53590 isoform X2 [Diospyros lotus]